MTGRPSDYTPELVSEICDRLSKGEPLAAICRDDHMPSRGTVYAWAKDRPDVSERIARARDDGFDAIAGECLEIADKTTVEDVQRDRLRVETRLKLLAKWDPKRYGDKVALTGGSEGDAPIKTQLSVKFV